MKHIPRIALLFWVLQLMISGSLFSQQTDDASRRSEFKQAINSCPGGLVFGIASLNYEQLVWDKVGLVARFDYEGVPKAYTDANIESRGYGLILQSRYHFSGEMKSAFVNLYTRGRIYEGAGELEGQAFDFTRPDLTVGLSAGKRWVWNSGFNILFQFGYGLQWHDRDVNNSSDQIEQRIDDFEDSYDFMDPFLGEFSIGYAF